MSDIDLLRNWFDEADTDKDGYLVKSEVRNAIMKSSIAPIVKEKLLSELDADFQMVDTNQDGKISFEEYKASLRRDSDFI
jgi:Ca2+-binding EF-hand superfamily protein